MDIFVREAQKTLGFGRDDVVLDIGCGTGLLEAALAPEVARILGVDTSSRLIEENQRRMKDQPAVSFHVLGGSYTDLSFLPEWTFTRIVCLSVVQYYRNTEEILELVRQVRRVARPPACLLIADVLLETSLLDDVLGLWKTAIQERLLFDTVKFLFKARFGDYHHVRQRQGMLTFSHESLEQLVAQIDAPVAILRQRMTLNDNRRHLLIRFPE